MYKFHQIPARCKFTGCRLLEDEAIVRCDKTMALNGCRWKTLAHNGKPPITVSRAAPAKLATHWLALSAACEVKEVCIRLSTSALTNSLRRTSFISLAWWKLAATSLQRLSGWWESWVRGWGHRGKGLVQRPSFRSSYSRMTYSCCSGFDTFIHWTI